MIVVTSQSQLLKIDHDHARCRAARSAGHEPVEKQAEVDGGSPHG